MVKRTLIINFKNYPEVMGEGSSRLAKAAQVASDRTGSDVIVAPPAPMLAMLASEVDIQVYAQAVSPAEGDRTTGAVLPEAVKSVGASGAILNHSESRVAPRELGRLAARLSNLSLDSCVCARTPSEAARLAGLGSRFLAIEPPELIGTGVAVSRAKPGLVSSAVEAARGSGYRGRVLCGAGIAGAEDVEKALQLGADGVMVSSGIVKARSWESRIEELVRPLG